MKVTNIMVKKVNPRDNGVCAEVSVILDDALCIHKILVIRGSKGLFIAFPHAYTKGNSKDNKRYVDIVHPTDNELRQHIQSEVLKKYDEEVNK